MKSRLYAKRFHSYREKINSLKADAKLDEKDMISLAEINRDILDSYTKGKITDQYYANLKNDISFIYGEFFQKKIEKLETTHNNTSSTEIENQMKDAYAKGDIVQLHYDLLKGRISNSGNNSKK
jgi:hypothetical protein